MLLLSLAANFSKKSKKAKSPSCGPKSTFTIDHHCKSDVCKTVDRTPQTANHVNYEKKLFKNLWRHYNVKSMGWVGSCGWGQWGKYYCAYLVGRTMRKQTRMLETFLAHVPADQFLLDWMGAIFGPVSGSYNTSIVKTYNCKMKK